MQDCTLLHYKNVHLCVARMYILVTQECTILHIWKQGFINHCLSTVYRSTINSIRSTILIPLLFIIVLLTRIYLSDQYILSFTEYYLLSDFWWQHHFVKHYNFLHLCSTSFVPFLVEDHPDRRRETADFS